MTPEAVAEQWAWKRYVAAVKRDRELAKAETLARAAEWQEARRRLKEAA